MGEKHIHSGHKDHGHAGPKQYIILALVLGVITYLEYWIFNQPSMRSNRGVMVPTLLGLSAAKFIIVCGWYMHLRFDPKWLTKMFVVGMGMAALTGIGLALLMA